MRRMGEETDKNAKCRPIFVSWWQNYAGSLILDSEVKRIAHIFFLLRRRLLHLLFFSFLLPFLSLTLEL